MNIIIRKGNENDLFAIFNMINELALFEKSPQSVTNSVEQMKQEQKYFHFLVAEHNGTIIASAIYFFAYYTWVGKSLYLDDLYVKPEYRRKKIGTRLFSKVVEIAQKENCKRLRWQVLDWNTNAIELYKKIGASITNEWLTCDLNEQQLKAFKNFNI